MHPQSTPTRKARRTATIAAPALDGEGELTRNCMATAPETAITEPTERVDAAGCNNERHAQGNHQNRWYEDKEIDDQRIKAAVCV